MSDVVSLPRIDIHSYRNREIGISSSMQKKGDKKSPLSPRAMRQDDEYHNNIIGPHFCGTIVHYNDILNIPGCLDLPHYWKMRTQLDLGERNYLYVLLSAQTLFFFWKYFDTYLGNSLCIFCQASLFLCPISLPLITPRHFCLSTLCLHDLSGALVKWCC